MNKTYRVTRQEMVPNNLNLRPRHDGYDVTLPQTLIDQITLEALQEAITVLRNYLTLTEWSEETEGALPSPDWTAGYNTALALLGGRLPVIDGYHCGSCRGLECNGCACTCCDDLED